MSTRDERKCFTFTWTIENISNNWLDTVDYLTSPVFVINELESKYVLRLRPKGFNGNSFIILVEKERMSAATIDCELALFSKDGVVIQLRKSNSVQKCDILHIEKTSLTSIYLADNKIIVRCRIWSSELTEDIKCDAVTRICIIKEAFIAKIQNFSTLQSEGKCFHQIKSMPNNEVLMTLDLLLKNPYTDEDSINIQLVSKNDKIKYCTLHLMPFMSFGSINQGIRKEFLFSDNKMPKLFSLPFSKNDLIAHKDLCLPNDVLSFRCECTFSTGDITNEIERVIYGCENLASIEPDNQCFEGNILSTSKRILNDNLKSMFYDSIFPDITLKTSTKTFQAHKSILGARSPVFKSVFSTNMKEKFNNCVDIEDFDSDTVHRMLQYIYTAEIKDLQWESAFELYGAADKYQILALRDECSTYLKSNLSPKNACNALILADMHQDEDLKASVQEFIFKYDIFDTKEWEHLIKTHTKLTVDTMHLHIQRKLKSKGNNYSMIKQLFGKEPVKLNSASPELKCPTTKTTFTSPVLNSNGMNKSSQASFSFDNSSGDQSSSPIVVKAKSDQTPPAFSKLSNNEGDTVCSSRTFNSNETETPSECVLKFGWTPISKTKTVYPGANSSNLKLSASKGFNLSTKKESSFSNSSQTTPAKTSSLFENITEKEPSKQSIFFGNSNIKESVKPSFLFVNVREKESVKSPFLFRNRIKKKPTKPSFSYGKVSEKEPYKSPFSFSNSDKTEPIEPSFSVGNVSEREPFKSPFSFGSGDKEPIKPSFSFGNLSFGSSNKKEFIAPSFSDGNISEKEPFKSPFSFGNGDKKEPIEPSFSFGNLSFGSSDKKEFIVPSFSFGNNNWKEPNKLSSASGFNGKESSKLSLSFGSRDKNEFVTSSFSFGNGSKIEPIKPGFSFDNISGKESNKSFSFQNCSDKDPIKPCHTFSKSDEKNLPKQSDSRNDTKETSFLFNSSAEKESVKKCVSHSNSDAKKSVKPSDGSSNEREPVKSSFSLSSSSEKEVVKSSSFANSGYEKQVKSSFWVSNNSEKEPDKQSFIFFSNNVKESINSSFFVSSGAEACSQSSRLDNGTKQKDLEYHRHEHSSPLTTCTTNESVSAQMSSVNDSKAKISPTSLGFKNINENRLTESPIINSISETPAAPNGITSVIHIKPSEPSFSLRSLSMKTPSSPVFNSNNDVINFPLPSSHTISVTVPVSPTEETTEIDTASTKIPSATIGCSNSSLDVHETSGNDIAFAKIPYELDCTVEETPLTSIGCDSSSTNKATTSGNYSSNVKPLTSFELDCTSKGIPANSGCSNISPDELATSGNDSSNSKKIQNSLAELICTSATTSLF